MAYVREKRRAIPVPGADPGVVSAYVPITSAECNVPIKVPWDGCKLVYGYTTFVSNNASGVLDGGDCEVDLELDAASGTEIASATIASGATVGTVDEFTIGNHAAASGLDSANSINIEVDGNAGTTVGGLNVYLYFEPDSY